MDNTGAVRCSTGKGIDRFRNISVFRSECFCLPCRIFVFSGASFWRRFFLGGAWHERKDRPDDVPVDILVDTGVCFWLRSLGSECAAIVCSLRENAGELRPLFRREFFGASRRCFLDTLQEIQYTLL